MKKRVPLRSSPLGAKENRAGTKELLNETLRGTEFFDEGQLPLCVFRMPLVDWGRSLHSHDFFEIMIVTGGMALHHIDGRDETMRMGDVYVLPPGMVHGYEMTKGGAVEVVNVLFHAQLIEGSLGDLRKVEGFSQLFGGNLHKHGEPHLKLPAGELAHVTAMIEKIEAEQEEMTTGWEFYCETKFRELILSSRAAT